MLCINYMLENTEHVALQINVCFKKKSIWSAQM